MGQTTTASPVNKKPTTEQSFLAYLSGKKTYTVAGMMIVYAVLGWSLHQFDQTTALYFIFNALGISGLRSGIASLSS